MKKLLSAFVVTAVTLCGTSAGANNVIPDHRGTSMDNMEIGTARLNSNVISYYELFRDAGDQYGVDPNLLAAICMQESSGRNLSYREDGSEYPAWGIMQIEYTLEESFASFGMEREGVRWTLEDRLDETKAVPFAAYLISQSLIRYDCDYMKMIQAYNFGTTVLDRIIEAKGGDWLSERANAAAYASNWPYEKYGDAQYIEHVLRYYHNDIPYIGAKVRINGELLSFNDQYPLLETINGGTYTMIPVRAVSEALDADVKWNGGTNTVTITKDSHKMILFLNASSALMDGEDVPLEAPAMLKNGRTMVPLRFVLEAFDVGVDWDGDTRTVLISK